MHGGHRYSALPQFVPPSRIHLSHLRCVSSGRQACRLRPNRQEQKEIHKCGSAGGPVFTRWILSKTLWETVVRVGRLAAGRPPRFAAGFSGSALLPVGLSPRCSLAAAPAAPPAEPLEEDEDEGDVEVLVEALRGRRRVGRRSSSTISLTMLERRSSVEPPSHRRNQLCTCSSKSAAVGAGSCAPAAAADSSCKLAPRALLRERAASGPTAASRT